jgi:hemoglobin-like flavoprotein
MATEPALPAPKTVTIIDVTIPVLEYKGTRVITLAMMDMLHHRTDGTAGRNFREHKDKLEEGKHYFHLTSQDVKSFDEFRRMGVSASPQGLVLLTERGYSLLVKSFSDEIAWEVQDHLVDGYFDTKKPMTTAEFLVQQAQLILEHDNRIKRLEQRQSVADIHIAETRHEIALTKQRAEEAFEAASAALQHKYGNPDYSTVVGFCNRHSIKINQEEAKARGLHATHVSRDLGMTIIKVPDERYGKVNSYHVSALEKVFADKLSPQSEA